MRRVGRCISPTNIPRATSRYSRPHRGRWSMHHQLYPWNEVFPSRLELYRTWVKQTHAGERIALTFWFLPSRLFESFCPSLFCPSKLVLLFSVHFLAPYADARDAHVAIELLDGVQKGFVLGRDEDVCVVFGVERETFWDKDEWSFGFFRYLCSRRVRYRQRHRTSR